VAKPLSHGELKASLHNRYKESHWILLEEVRDASGFDGLRSIDAVAFGLYSSRGYEVHAFECKAQRSDWLKELRSPQKADEFARIVDKFWIVANKGVVKKKEVPSEWGLIIASRHGDGYRLHISVQAIAPRGERPLPRAFVASMLTRMKKKLELYRRDAIMRSELQAEFKERYDRGYRAAELESGRYVERYEKLEQVVQEFQEASGVHISQYTDGKKLGAFVALCKRLESEKGWDGFLDRVKKMSTGLREITDKYLSMVRELDAERAALLRQLEPDSQLKGDSDEQATGMED